MRKTVVPEPATPVLQPPLTISAEQVCFVIVKAREFETRDLFLEPDSESNPSDDNEVDVLEDHGDDPVLDDPVVEELTSFIDELSEDEQVDLVALAWLGRDGGDLDDWSETREEALRAHNEATAAYLLEMILKMPQVATFLEAGLSTLGFSCEDFEIGRL
jgi:hypothetical protein